MPAREEQRLADAREDDATLRYVRGRQLATIIADAMRRADAMSRLDATLRLADRRTVA